ncbi:MAG TPA: CoA-transferase [bacterium]|nr:CoA-transferase [bacterium]
MPDPGRPAVTFVEARRRLEAKARPPRDKRMPIADAAGLVRDGDHLAIGGCLYSRTPTLLLREVLRRRRRGVVLSRSLMCYEGELFLAAGASREIVTSWVGIGLPWGLSRIVREFVEGGQARYEEWSHLAIGLRYHAGAMGVPFLPTLSMLGSDLLRTTGAKTMTCPFTGEQLCLVPALFPDVALIHVHRADRFGNAQIDGYPHMDADIAAAAQTVILTAEEIVDPDEIRRTADRTVIPFFAVDAVVEAPYGAYPHECYGLYEADLEHIDAYARRVGADGVAAARAYLDEYVYGPPTPEAYLSKFNAAQLARQRRAAEELTGR